MDKRISPPTAAIAALFFFFICLENVQAALPVSKAGNNISSEKKQVTGTFLYLDGSLSSDPDNDALTYHWFGPFQTVNTISPEVFIPQGKYAISLIVDDGFSYSQSDTVAVTVEPCFSLTTRTKSGKIQLTWSHIEGTRMYHIYRSDQSSPSSFEKIAQTTSTYSTHLDSGVTNDLTYIYIVGAENEETVCFSEAAASVAPSMRNRGVNYAPYIFSEAVEHATSKIPYTYDVNGVDPNGTSLFYSLPESPPGMTIDPNSGQIQWVPVNSGICNVIVQASDGSLYDRQTFSINVENLPALKSLPRADAGQDVTDWVMPGQDIRITLDGSGSSAPDGETISTFAWTGTPDPEDSAGPTVSLSAGVYIFTLTVFDKRGNAGLPDTVKVTVMEYSSPVLSVASGEYVVNEGNLLTIEVSAADADGDEVTLSCAPQLANADFLPVTTVNPSALYRFLPDYTQAGSYTVTFMATDVRGLVDKRTVSISVTNVNRAPTADAGPDQQAGMGQAVTLNGAGSTDADGDLLGFRWTLISLPENSSATLNDPAAVDPVVTPDRPGAYVVQLVVNDGTDNSPPDTVIIEANAGHVQLNPATLNLSTLTSGTLTLSLSQPAAPGGRTVNLVSSNPSVATVPGATTITGGETTVSFEVTTLVSEGATVISVSGDGMSEQSATVNVSLRTLALTVDNPFIEPDRMSSAAVHLALPAPAGGATVAITTSAPDVAAISVNTVGIAENETSVVFQIDGLTEGTADISVSAPGYAPATAMVTVTEGKILLGDILALAPDQVGSLPVILSRPAPAGGITVTLSSRNHDTFGDPAAGVHHSGEPAYTGHGQCRRNRR